MTVRKPPAFNAGELNVYTKVRDAADVCRALRTTGRRIVLVPTMGALHEGHLALVRTARRVPGAVVVVSIFVNPLQFGAGEDLDAYPRTLDADLAALQGEGVEIVFTPTAAEMYPHGQRTTVRPGPLGAELEGGSRPTHFAGMLTVVLKLLQIVRPDRAYFGEKDYQQLVLVRQMSDDLDLDVQIVGVPIVREADGLAMSSRNRYLDRWTVSMRARVGCPARRDVRRSRGARGVGCRPRRARRGARHRGRLVEVRDPWLGPAPAEGPARMLVAARLGTDETAGQHRHRRRRGRGHRRASRVDSGQSHELPWRNCGPRAASDRRSQHPHRRRIDLRLRGVTRRWCSSGGFAPKPRSPPTSWR